MSIPGTTIGFEELRCDSCFEHIAYMRGHWNNAELRIYCDKCKKSQKEYIKAWATGAEPAREEKA